MVRVSLRLDRALTRAKNSLLEKGLIFIDYIDLISILLQDILQSICQSDLIFNN